jgi:hypothetical protein
VIDPAVRIEDVDPVGFARLNAALARRDAQTRSTLTVIHRAGVVNQASAPNVSDIDDPDALRAAHGVDEVVLLDQDGLDDLSARLADAARHAVDQAGLLAACRQIYLDHWAVTVVPRPGPSRWAPVEELVAAVPDGGWLVGRDECWTVAAQVQGGRIVRITSHPPEDAHVVLTMQGTAADTDAVLLAEDPLTELRARFEIEGEVPWPA